MEDFKEVYSTMTKEGQYIYDLIIKYHLYFSKKDRSYRFIVQMLKVIILLCAMGNTIILGLKGIIDSNIQITSGLILSALLTFFTAIAAYFNFEEYWMRNITIHIRLNIMRDNYIYDAKANGLTTEKIEEYRKELEKIQNENISYWKKAIKRI